MLHIPDVYDLNQANHMKQAQLYAQICNPTHEQPFRQV